MVPNTKPINAPIPAFLPLCGLVSFHTIYNTNPTIGTQQPKTPRSEERRVGKEC